MPPDIWDIIWLSVKVSLVAVAGTLPVAFALRCASFSRRTLCRLMSSPLAIATSTSTPAEMPNAAW